MTKTLVLMIQPSVTSLIRMLLQLRRKLMLVQEDYL
jgi:hypothetical protein